MKAIVLAGGLGTRLRSVVNQVPKPMAPVDGKPFLEYLLSYWLEQGVDSFILSIGYLGDLVVEHFGESYGTASIRYVQEESLLGTGGALLKSLEALREEETVLLLNGDTLFKVDLGEFLSFHRSARSEFSLSLFRSSDPRYAGVDVDGMGRVLGVGGDASPGERLVNGGVYLLEKRTFVESGGNCESPCSLESDILPDFVRAGYPVFARLSGSFFIDIGVPDDYSRFEKLVRTGERNFSNRPHSNIEE